MHQADSDMQSRATAATVSTVLDNDDLLGEVLLRVAQPTSLVRVALVCRRWLRVAADLNFLARFHDRHPPRLLGFYVHSAAHLRGAPRFAPMPGLPRELAAIVRRAGSALDAYATDVTSTASVLDCLDGHLLVRLGDPNSHRDLVLSPMLPPAGRGGPPVVVAPPPPLSPSFYDHEATWLKFRDDDDFPRSRRGVTVCAAWSHRADQTISRYNLIDGAWHELCSSAPKTKIPPLIPPNLSYILIPFRDKIYLVSSASAIDQLRRSESSETWNVSLVAFPDGVKYELRHKGKLQAWADSSFIYLIKVGTKKLQLRVWRYGIDSETWSLEDTICLRMVFAHSRVLTSVVSQDGRGVSKGTDVVIHRFGPRRGSMCMLLQVGNDVLYINIKSRTAEKVYTVAPEDGDSIRLVPFDMIFSLVFPVINNDNDQS